MDKRIKAEKRPSAQPVKISQERIDAILKDISEGSTRFHASEANGIAYSTFYFWTKQGQFDLAHGIDSIEAKLVKALRSIEQDEIKECRSGIKSSEKGHIGKQWTLEKVYWQHFGGNAPVIELAEEMRLEKGRIKDEIRDKSGSKEGDKKV